MSERSGRQDESTSAVGQGTSKCLPALVATAVLTAGPGASEAHAQASPQCRPTTAPALVLTGLPPSIRPSRTEVFGLAATAEGRAQVPGSVRIEVIDRLGRTRNHFEAAPDDRASEAFSVWLDRGDRRITVFASYVEVDPAGEQCLRVVSQTVLEGAPMRLVLGTRGSAVAAVGPFRPRRNATLRAAIRHLGEPTSNRSRFGGNGCRVGWRPLGLVILFSNFGGASACDADDGRAQSLVIRGRRGRQWRTTRGLRIGDPTRKLRRRYPTAVRRGRSWRLVPGRSFIGAGCGGRGCPFSVLAARTSAGRVSELRGWIGAAGD